MVRFLRAADGPHFQVRSKFRAVLELICGRSTLRKELQKQTTKNLTKQNPTLPRQVFMSLIWGGKKCNKSSYISDCLNLGKLEKVLRRNIAVSSKGTCHGLTFCVSYQLNPCFSLDWFSVWQSSWYRDKGSLINGIKDRSQRSGIFFFHLLNAS